MKDVGFIGYVGRSDFHDGVILRVSVEGKTAEVVIRGFSGREHVIVFEGVDEVEQNTPEGMLLYSLSEMRTQPPSRKFVFVNSQENHPAFLSVVAKDFCICSE